MLISSGRDVYRSFLSCHIKGTSFKELVFIVFNLACDVSFFFCVYLVNLLLRKSIYILIENLYYSFSVGLSLKAV